MADVTWEDGSAADGALADTVQSDRARPDAAQSDAFLPDTTQADARRQDSAAPDTLAPDAAEPDTLLPDAAEPDTLLPDAAGPDTLLPDAAQPPCNGSPPTAPFCDPSDATQAACYTFEGNANDGSQYGTDGTGYNVSYQAGHDGQAVLIAGTSGSEIQVPDGNLGSSLEITPNLVIEMWIYPFSLPSSGRISLMDNDGQYGFFINSSNQIYCAGGNANVTGAAVATGAWTHVACVFNNSDRSLRIYNDGVETGVVDYNIDSASALSIDNANHVAIGAESPGGNDNLDGLMDSLRVWSAPRSADDICWDAQP